MGGALWRSCLYGSYMANKTFPSAEVLSSLFFFFFFSYPEIFPSAVVGCGLRVVGT